MKSAATKRYHNAQTAYWLCKDVSQLPALARELAEAEVAFRDENPGAFYQAAQQVVDEAPKNEDR